jgi:YbgC/YbaW family acyl-CoA thioester hydrolase
VIVYQRPIRFDEVDPAGIVFFARYANLAHEAIENLFSDLEGGYPALIGQRRIGLPIVHLEADFRAPLRYGDQIRIETSCEKLGRTSATLVHQMKNAATGGLCAIVRHVVVTVSLDTFRSCPMPADVRATLERHVAPG